jgi:hypothetical protein
MMYADSVSIHIEKIKKWIDKNPRQLTNYRLTVNNNEHGMKKDESQKNRYFFNRLRYFDVKHNEAMLDWSDTSVTTQDQTNEIQSELSKSTRIRNKRTEH